MKFKVLLLFAAVLFALLLNPAALFAVDHSEHNMPDHDADRPAANQQSAGAGVQQATGGGSGHGVEHGGSTAGSSGNQGNSVHEGHVTQESLDSGIKDNRPLLGGFGLIIGLILLSAAILKRKSQKRGGSQIG